MEETLALAAAAESCSEHPLAAAVLNYAAAVLVPCDLAASTSGGRRGASSPRATDPYPAIWHPRVYRFQMSRFSPITTRTACPNDANLI